jgi:sulfur dioxygenase
MSCGRADFQSGSATALYRSITEVLFALPEETIVWPGHDYQGRTNSSIGQEKRSNPRIAGKTLAEFKTIMDELNLPKPKRMDEAVPANLTSGMRHDAGGASLGPQPKPGYAGDVAPDLAYAWWRQGDAVLVDVRSDAEREWVGFIPDAARVAWKQWPGMALNPAFDDALKAAVPPGKKALLLCRSGVRSIAAAKRATELGIEAYNILEGFEGDPDEHGQRGRRGGWRMRGLPWRQG